MNPRHERVQIADDYEAMSRQAARFVLEQLRVEPEALLCLATGASPARTYELLAEQGGTDPDLFSRTRFLALDEWGGLPAESPATCANYLRRYLIEPLHISTERFFFWESQPADPATECQRVSSWLEGHGPITLAILGIGVNGHLGLNEPGIDLEAGPHIATLTESSRSHGMLGEFGAQPAYGLTLGMADILHAHKILLLVSGAQKAQPLRRLRMGRVSTQFPASLLCLHPAVTVFCDRVAAGFDQ